MQSTMLKVRRADVEMHQAGAGAPVLYLHGVYDTHTLRAGLFPFHERLAERCQLLAPAHPGCGESTGVKDVTDIEDLAFHYLDVLDALGLQKATVVGYDLGAWIAAEMAVRNPERFEKLALIGAAGLQLPDGLIGDVFMYAQHRDGGIMRELRDLMFADPDGDIANAIIPDGRVAVADEVRRYKSLTITGRVGWEPPYLHNRKLADRLHRIACPTLLVWGAEDRFVPLANGRAYTKALPQASLSVIDGAGHSVILEKPQECIDLIAPFLETGRLAESATEPIAASA